MPVNQENITNSYRLQSPMDFASSSSELMQSPFLIEFFFEMLSKKRKMNIFYIKLQPS